MAHMFYEILYIVSSGLLLLGIAGCAGCFIGLLYMVVHDIIVK